LVERLHQQFAKSWVGLKRHRELEPS
jgi:hypothetical protein